MGAGLVWSENIIKNCISSHCAVKFIPLQLKFDVTFVYAFNSREDKVKLWDYLRRVQQVCGKAWMVLRDFNVILHKEDQMGGNAVFLTEVHKFQSCVEDYQLEEMPSNRGRYTWNDRQQIDRVFFKIYWVFKNGEWMDNMPKIKSYTLPEGECDHCPTLINLVHVEKKIKPIFKYYNIWNTHPSFEGLVNEVWDIQINRYNMFKVVSKLKLLKRKSSRLHKDQFVHLMGQVNTEREALKKVQDKLQDNSIDNQL